MHQHERPTIPQDLPAELPHHSLLHRALSTIGRRTTRGQFTFHLMPLWGVPLVIHGGRSVVHDHNLLAMMAWAQAEGQGGRFNMLNCTMREEGSTTFNTVGVQNYPSFQTGLLAHAQTLNIGARDHEFGYDDIRHALHIHAAPAVVLRAVEQSSWGTGGLALRVYEETPNEVLRGYRHHRLARKPSISERR